MRRTLLCLFVAAAIVAGACSSSNDTSISTTDARGTTVTVVTHDSFAVSEEVLELFTERTGVTVEIVRSGDAGSAVNQAILTKGNPLGDVFFGVDNTFLSRALDAGIFTPYRARRIDEVDATYRLDPENRVTPVDHGEVCLNYDKEAFSASPPPSSLDDLITAQYKGQLVVENPAT
ncbi:MAG: thiamine ABC transporter substrate-binding protein, partial [Acidimicrobiales bacterium]